MSERESDDDERDDLDEEEEESPPPPKAKSKAAASKAGASSSKAGGGSGGKSAGPAAGAAMMPFSRGVAIGVVALAAGGVAGWFGHIQKAKAALHAEVMAAPTGSGAPAGPCGAWQSKICGVVGDQSAPCQQAKGAASLLTQSTCEAALGALPETLVKVKAERASCDKLVSKLCQDLPPGSKTCDMVKARTPSFPRERCEEMLGSYDKVIAELKQMDQQGGMQMGGMPQRMPPGGMPPGGMPPGGMPPGGMPPGGMPPGGMPPGAAPPGGMPHITIPQHPSSP
ncbi:MAG TPA: hypothetical protein VNW92_18250 [Polyangiaceae bacterium]|jgi:hypothetical protein|nr:hypothetical protein [Polyangiaceae bacterium]